MGTGVSRGSARRWRRVLVLGQVREAVGLRVRRGRGRWLLRIVVAEWRRWAVRERERRAHAVYAADAVSVGRCGRRLAAWRGLTRLAARGWQATEHFEHRGMTQAFRRWGKVTHAARQHRAAAARLTKAARGWLAEGTFRAWRAVVQRKMLLTAIVRVRLRPGISTTGQFIWCA